MREPELPTREQEAIAEMAATSLSRGVGVALAGVYFVLVLLWWGAELLVGGIEWRALGVSAASRGKAGSSLLALNRTLGAAAAQIEHAFDRESAFTRTVRGPVQALLTGLLGAGNEQAYPGRDGWVIFREDFDYLTGPGFLEPRRLARPGADPRKAIVAMQRELADRGIVLLLLPVPVKPAIHPEVLGQDRRSAPLRNRSEIALLGELDRAGVVALDLGPELAARARGGESQFLRGDSHWRPEAVEHTARLLAVRLRELAPLPPPSSACVRTEARVSAAGDSIQLLGLPRGSRLFVDEEVTLRQVGSLEGDPWRPTRGAPVLLLGDSFSNIYSNPELGWGQGAGLAEQLSCELGLPVDRIARNAGGARGAREELAGELARGVDRLSGVRAVVWQFAARELATGDWTPIELRLGRESPHAPIDSDRAEVLRGVARAVAALPDARRAPYREALGAVELVLDEGGSALVYLWALRDGSPGELAKVRPGQRLELVVAPWSAQEAELGSLQRMELPGESWWGWPVYVTRDQEGR